MQDVFRVTCGGAWQAGVGPTPGIFNKRLMRSNLKISDEVTIRELVRDWTMVVIMLGFVLLYAIAFTGKLDPLKDSAMLLRLEPIIFILVGFYFGRLPGRHGERFFRDEIARHVQRADAAQFAKENALLERDALEERIRNAARTLKTIERSGRGEQRAVTNAINILDS